MLLPASDLSNTCAKHEITEMAIKCKVNFVKIADNESVHYCTDCDVHRIDRLVTNEYVEKDSYIKSEPQAPCYINFEQTLESNHVHCDMQQLPQHVELVNQLKNYNAECLFICKHCQKWFSSGLKLNQHLNAHTGERNFICKHCRTQFRWQSSLHQHLKRHADHRHFICGNCQKQFPRKVDLERHLKSHNGERSFACEHCSKQFLWKSSLKRHLETHTGERFF